MQRETFALHRAVWRGAPLDAALLKDVDALDVRGNTALHIAAHFGYTHAVQQLLDAGADGLKESRAGLKAVDEAVASGARDCAALLLKAELRQRAADFRSQWPARKAELEAQPDCHWSMLWTFDLLHIHLSVLAPSDTYRVYKRGADVRADYSLLGFSMHVNRANLSILLRDGHVYAINHDAQTVQDLTGVPEDEEVLSGAVDSALNYLLAHDVVAHVPYGWRDPAIAPRFKRDKAWFTGRALTEAVGDAPYECAVYKTVGIQFVSLIRSDPHAKKTRIPRGRVAPDLLLRERALETRYFDGAADALRTDGEDERDDGDDGNDDDADDDAQHGGARGGWRDGLIWQTERVQQVTRSFAGKLWLCRDFPMERRALLPILSCLSLASPAFQYLHRFLTELPLPAGFPLRLEVPIMFPVSAVAEVTAYEPLPAEARHDAFFAVPAAYRTIVEPYMGHETREMMKTVKH